MTKIKDITSRLALRKKCNADAAEILKRFQAAYPQAKDLQEIAKAIGLEKRIAHAHEDIEIASGKPPLLAENK